MPTPQFLTSAIAGYRKAVVRAPAATIITLSAAAVALVAGTVEAVRTLLGLI